MSRGGGGGGGVVVHSLGGGVITHHPLHVKGGVVVVFEGATGQHSVPLLRSVTERSHWRLGCVQTAVHRHQAVYNSGAREGQWSPELLYL